MLCCAILYYTILYYTILYYTILYYTILYYTILYYTILYYTILYYTILYYTILHYTILYYTIQYYTILYYTILYWNASTSSSWRNPLAPTPRPAAPRWSSACRIARTARCVGLVAYGGQRLESGGVPGYIYVKVYKRARGRQIKINAWVDG